MASNGSDNGMVDYNPNSDLGSVYTPSNAASDTGVSTEEASAAWAQAEKDSK